MAEINWGIINNTPNVFAMGVEGLQAGQQAAAQRQRQDLVQRQAQREEDQYQAGVAATARRKAALSTYATDPNAGRQQALQAGDFDLVDQINKLDAGQRELVAKNNADVAAFAAGLKNKPVADRKAALNDPRSVQYLTARGFSPEQIAGFDPTDQALDTVIAQGMKVSEILDQQNKDRTFNHTVEKDAGDAARADKTLNETGRHNQATEGISRGQLAVSQGQLGVSRQRIGIEAAKAAREAAAGKPPTEAQAKDGFSAARMRGAAQTINGLEKDGAFNPTLTKQGSAFGIVGGGTKSRQYEAAKGEWIDSIIRATTGAAATKQEVESADRTYFPQLGDSADVIRQKADARRRVQTDMTRRAGPGAPPVTTAADPLGIR